MIKMIKLAVHAERRNLTASPSSTFQPWAEKPDLPRLKDKERGRKGKIRVHLQGLTSNYHRGIDVGIRWYRPQIASPFAAYPGGLYEYSVTVFQS